MTKLAIVLLRKKYQGILYEQNRGIHTYSSFFLLDDEL